MRACLIFNPHAGTAEQVKHALRDASTEHHCELRATSAAGDAEQFARQAIQDGVDRIIVAGGDGTVGQVVSGIAADFNAIELAIIPVGTGNDLARSLGLAIEDPSRACRAAFSTGVVPIDVIRIGGGKLSYCVNVANGGFGGQVAADVDQFDKQRWGPMAYWMNSVSALRDLHPFEVTLQLEGREVHTPSYGIAVANGRFVGGGFAIAPDAWLDDGFLDVTTIPVLPMLELMAAGMNFVLGRDHHDERVVTHRVRKVKITSNPAMPFSIDGEPQRPVDASFEVVPGRLRVVAGRAAVGLRRSPGG
jgi:YegS/Rv2252/BmrU family lipid kinase